MTMKEKLEKLHTISVCIANIEVTCDMGMQFDVMTGNGVSTNIGNVGQWPCFGIYIDEATKQLVLDLKAGKPVSDEDMLKVEFCRQLTSYNNFINPVSLFEDEKTKRILDIIREKVVDVDIENEYFYAYASPEDWNMEFFFYSTQEELGECMVEHFGSDDWLYSDMNEEEINYWYKTAEENDWECIPYNSIGF